VLEINKTLLVYRNWSGVGDWIMAMTVLKMVNQQFPDIDIYVNLKARNYFAEIRNEPIELPNLVKAIIKNFNVKIKGYTFLDKPENFRKDYDYISGNMTYTKNGINFIEGMVDGFNQNTQLKLKYDKNVFAQYSHDYAKVSIINEPYILMQSCSKRRELERNGKEYGFNNMVSIANNLSNYSRVVQLGQKGDLEIPNISIYLEVPLNLLYSLMINCIAFVGLDGGLGVFASHHNIKQFIIYKNANSFSWTNFPNRIQIDGSKLNPEKISKLIIDNLEEVYA